MKGFRGVSLILTPKPHKHTFADYTKVHLVLFRQDLISLFGCLGVDVADNTRFDVARGKDLDAKKSCACLMERLVEICFSTVPTRNKICRGGE